MTRSIHRNVAAGLCLVMVCVAAPVHAKAPELAEVKVFPADVNLTTMRDRQSLVVQATYADGLTRDVTGQATYTYDKSLVRLDQATFYPLKDGTNIITVKFGGRALKLPLKVEQAKVDRPKFTRTDQCLECHASAKSMGVPGHLLRSFATDESGVVDLASGIGLVNHRTPIAERWGGWYVTGEHGSQPHRGNLIGKAAFARQEAEPNYLGDIQDLSKYFDAAPYIEKTSDITALLVLEHQAHMHNFITRLNYESTIALQQYGHLNYLRNILDSFVKYMLFAEEAPLGAPVKGSEQFARDFVAQGPRDRQGRSLRDFDLRTRLFRFPCSYLVYSEAFDALPAKAKEQIYQRLFDVLTGKRAGPDWQHLAPGTRDAIREILAETKPGLPAYWKQKE